MSRTDQELRKELLAPFPADSIKWRIGVADKQGKWAQILCYIDARDVMDRLDDVFGIFGWHDRYQEAPAGGVLCILEAGDKERWCSKSDAAENTDIEAVKGGMSDAFKRAAVKWGIGRYLYSIGTTWAVLGQDRKDPTTPYWHRGKDGVAFAWGPPHDAYYRLGYSDDDIGLLPYYGKPQEPTRRKPRAKAAPGESELCGEIVGAADPAWVGHWMDTHPESDNTFVAKFAKAKLAILACKTRDEVTEVYKSFREQYFSGQMDGDRAAVSGMWDEVARLRVEAIKDKGGK